MPTTSPDGFPYPLPSQAPDVPADLEALADALQAKAVTTDAAIAAILSRMLNMDSDAVATEENTSSTSYANLTTAGPAVTLTSTAGFAVVAWAANMWASAATSGGAVSVEISGATATAAADPIALMSGGLINTSGFGIRASTLALMAVNPGSNTFTLKYKASSGTAFFRYRSLYVWAP